MKHALKRMVLFAGTCLLSLSISSQAALLITDDFENRAVSSALNNSATSGPNEPETWYWQGASGGAPIISQQNSGNKFVDFSGMGFSSLSLSSVTNSSGRIALSSTTHYQLKYDLLWLNNYAGTIVSGFSVFFNTNNTFANFSIADTPGYLFRAAVTAANTVTWEIQQNANQTIASGTTTINGVLPSINGTAGTPIPVQIDWTGNAITLTINGVAVWDSQQTPFNPASQNITLPDTTYLMFQLVQSRNQGIDNFSLAAIPEPSTIAFLSVSGILLIGWNRRQAGRVL